MRVQTTLNLLKGNSRYGWLYNTKVGFCYQFQNLNLVSFSSYFALFIKICEPNPENSILNKITQIIVLIIITTTLLEMRLT